MKIRRSDHGDIVEAYDIKGERAEDIGNRYGVTRQHVYKVLKQQGIDTSKRQVPVSCAVCGNVIMRHRSRIRTQLNHFCDMVCYQAFLEAGSSHLTPTEARKGGRRARRVVEKFFELKQGHIVHHKDRNQLNNTAQNLTVYACQGDHMRIHRGFAVEPLWDGGSVDIFKRREGSAIDVLSELVASAREYDPALIKRIRELLG